jgi:hypothetical protein
MRAFRSMTLWISSSVGPTWATVTPPAFDPPDASRCTGRFLSGSSSVAAPKTGAAVTVRLPSLNVTSNFMSSGMLRPSEVPRRNPVLPRAATAVTVAPPRPGTDMAGRALTALEREEIHAAARGQDVGDLPVLVHSDRVTRRGLPPCSRRAIAPDIGRGGRLEEWVHLGGDDEEDGENAGDDDDAADHHEPGRPPVKEDTPARASPADAEGTRRGSRPPASKAPALMATTVSWTILLSRWWPGWGSSRP